MRRGCVSLGEVKCDECQRTLPHGERYLIIEEAEGARLHLCVDCCLKQGYARYKVEKREQVLTFFVE